MEGGTEQQNDSQMHRLLGGFPQCFYLTSSPLYSKAGKADNCELYDMFFVLFCFYDFFFIIINIATTTTKMSRIPPSLPSVFAAASYLLMLLKWQTLTFLVPQSFLITLGETAHLIQYPVSSFCCSSVYMMLLPSCWLDTI